MGEMDSQFTVS